MPGDKNIINNTLFDEKNILSFPAHKTWCDGTIYQNSRSWWSLFRYICSTFPSPCNEKKKAGISDGSQIKTLLKDSHFLATMTEAQARAWNAFYNVMQNFLGNKKADNYQEIVEELLLSLQGLGYRMRIKVHYLNSHLGEFPENLGDMSEEHGKCFHEDTVVEECYQGRWDSNTTDYCWSLMRHIPEAVHQMWDKRRKFT